VKPQILRVVASFHGGVDLCNSMDRCAGQSYYIAEATRAISDFEDLFYDGKRADHLATSAQIKYPNLLVLAKGDERLILLFNEGASVLTVELTNKDVKLGQTATIWGQPEEFVDPKNMEVTVPPNDVTLVHIR
jgi:hypothetical protein